MPIPPPISYRWGDPVVEEPRQVEPVLVGTVVLLDRCRTEVTTDPSFPNVGRPPRERQVSGSTRSNCIFSEREQCTSLTKVMVNLCTILCSKESDTRSLILYPWSRLTVSSSGCRRSVWEKLYWIVPTLVILSYSTSIDKIDVYLNIPMHSTHLYLEWPFGTRMSTILSIPCFFAHLPYQEHSESFCHILKETRHHVCILRGLTLKLTLIMPA